MNVNIYWTIYCTMYWTINWTNTGPNTGAFLEHFQERDQGLKDLPMLSCWWFESNWPVLTRCQSNICYWTVYNYDKANGWYLSTNLQPCSYISTFCIAIVYKTGFFFDLVRLIQTWQHLQFPLNFLWTTWQHLNILLLYTGLYIAVQKLWRQVNY